MTTDPGPNAPDWRPWDSAPSETTAESPQAPPVEHHQAPVGPPQGWSQGEATTEIPLSAPASPHAAGPTAGPPQSAGHAARPEPAWAAAPYSTPPGYGPATSYAAPPPGGPAPDTSGFPPPSTPPRRGPGWGSLVGVAVVATLLSGTVGGLVGAAVADRETATSATASGATAGPRPGPGATSRPAGSIAQIAAAATPSVVTLQVVTTSGEATGSGWVYDDRGHIVTNNHVVGDAKDPANITVVLSDGTHRTGKVVGKDASYDLAVVQVDSKGLTPLPVGSSSQVVVGDEVIAVGAPLGLESTVTSGIVSALDRPVTPGGSGDQSFINAIQTDAAINPGNSGGPLLNMSGEVIGVNSAIARVSTGLSTDQSGNIGVGFAIPSDQVAITADQLIKTGKAEHPVIGVFLDTSYSGEGVRIAESGPDGQPAVNPGGPADRAGLKGGDVITVFDGKPVTDDGELVVRIRAHRIGDQVTMTVRRNGSDREVTMVLGGSGS